MRTITKAKYNASGQITEIVFRPFYGQVAECKGATSAETSLQQSQAQFYDLLRADYAQQFAGQQAILKAITAAWGPILKAGPGQYGFTSAEDTALRTQAKESTATAYQNAAKAVNEGFAAAGGGNELLPSGAQAQIQSQVATGAAESEASKNLGITEAGYERGYQEFLAATNAMTGNASLYSPTSYAGEANSAGTAAFNSAQAIQQADAAASPWGAVGGILGGAAGAFLGNPGTFAKGGPLGG